MQVQVQEPVQALALALEPVRVRAQEEVQEPALKPVLVALAAAVVAQAPPSTP